MTRRPLQTASGVPVLPLLIVVGFAGCDRGSSPPPTAAPFLDVTASVGIEPGALGPVSTEFFMPESMGPGCALLDYDGDGDLDIYLVRGARTSTGSANRLYRQDPGGRFTDVSEAAGAAEPGFGQGVAVGDVDNDGDLDIFVTNHGPDVLLRNEGNGTFRDVSDAAGIAGDLWSTSAGFLDYDGDGWLDLFVAHYLDYDESTEGSDAAGRPEYPSPSQFRGVPDSLYRNRGDGTFVDVSHEAGLADRPGKGLGVVFEDLDGDGRLDIYVANDGQPNFAWVQESPGRFDEQALARGLAVNALGRPEAGMGIAVGDADDDGDFDFVITHLVLETNTFYRQTSPGQFEDATAFSGLGRPSLDRTGFGALFLDVDLDGHLDLLVANGRVLRRPPHPRAVADPHWRPYAEPNQLFRGTGGDDSRSGAPSWLPRSPSPRSAAASPWGTWTPTGISTWS